MSSVNIESQPCPQRDVSSKVWRIFEHLYHGVTSLYTWVSRMDIDGLVLVHDGDPPGYVNFLHNALVAEMESQGGQLPTSLSQVSHQREVILRVIERLRRKNVNNVLTLGFGAMSDNPKAHISHIPSLEYRFPNSAFNRLQYSPWKTLLSRIGDQLMSLLLERTSVFYLVPPSNYVQLTGVPVYELWPSDSGKSLIIKPVCRKNKVTKNHHFPKKTKSEITDLGTPKKRHVPTTPGVKRQTGLKRKRDEGSNDGKKARRRGENTGGSKTFNPFDFHMTTPRHIMMYSKDLREHLPKSFCLSGLEPSVVGGTCLSGQILHHIRVVPCVPERTELEDTADTHTTHIGPLCQQILQNHRKCRYRSLLNHYCRTKSQMVKRSRSSDRIPRLSAPVFKRGAAGTRSDVPSLKRSGCRKLTTGQLLDDFTPHRQVFLFLRALCIKVIPLEMFGDDRNRKVFFKHLGDAVSLGQHEKYCLGQLMKDVKVKSYKCLQREPGGHPCQVRRVAQILWWLLNYFICPVIKAFFYVTNTNIYRNRVVYYRKSVWIQLHTRTLTALRQRKMMSPVTQTKVEHLLDSGHALGISYLRFLPKLTSLRPVVNMGRKPEPWTKKKLSINSQLRTCLSILQYHVHRRPELLQSSKFGFQDIYEAFREFVVKRRARQDTRPLYFVKTDINKCFDTIVQEKLYFIVKAILESEDEYITRRWASVFLAGDRLRRTYHRETFTLGEYEPDFIRYMRSRSEQLTDCLLVDQVMHPHLTADHLVSVVKSHLFNNIVKIGRGYFQQTVGIGQGSVLSTMLCSLYTAHLEQLTLGAAQEDELRMRLVDDNLYITPHRDKAVHFLNIALQGNKEYNFTSNMDKVLLNFEVFHPEQGLVPSVDSEEFPWCGMLFNTHSLEVMVDYDRYAGQAIRDTITIEFSTQPGVSMKNKLLMFLRYKCHGMYMDPQINSVARRIVSTYRVFLLAAYKLHCFVLNSWPASRRNNHRFLIEVILNLASYLHFKVKANVKQAVDEDGGSSLLPLPLVKWLCVQAHLVKLQQHHSMYSPLLSALKAYRKGFWRRMIPQHRCEVEFLKKNRIPVQFQQILER
ncbi:telomerase reverse transcriptase-like isoform X2 [Haliotis rufescens]|uniref:telomerase reverse transcriptase-like isoform X2 n=1 Tax=Haliotis rufescens TaxID=6454 RepID=UPI00201EB503|nr:telomerase reverse transcriptase-like isoform X2 [Haliotis rufescens]